MLEGVSMRRCQHAAMIAVGLVCAATSVAAQQPRTTIGYVEVAGDARYQPITAYGRMVLKSRERPFTGAQVAIDEAEALSRVLKTNFALERISVKSPAEVAATAAQARASARTHSFIAHGP